MEGPSIPARLCDVRGLTAECAFTKRRALPAYMRSLRHRLSLIGLRGKLTTIRGIGYRPRP